MTITLRPETEKALLEAAARRGVTPDDVIEEHLQDLTAAEEDAGQEAALRARVKAARGSLAHLGPSTRMQDKAEERAREERRWQQQDPKANP